MMAILIEPGPDSTQSVTPKPLQASHSNRGLSVHAGQKYALMLRDSNSLGRVEAEVVILAIDIPHVCVSVVLPFLLSLCAVCSSGLRRGISHKRATSAVWISYLSVDARI